HRCIFHRCIQRISVEKKKTKKQRSGGMNDGEKTVKGYSLACFVCDIGAADVCRSGAWKTYCLGLDSDRASTGGFLVSACNAMENI
ncbi:MAG: hypothetical protein ABTB30_13775, partial [Clostridia bacterium]